MNYSKKNVLAGIFVFLFVTSTLFGWTNTFGGSGLEEANFVQQTSDGGYVLCGYTVSLGAGSNDFILVKTAANGISSRTETYGGNYSDVGRSVQQTSDGGYVISGYTLSFGAGSRDFYLVKTDASGSAVEENIISTPVEFSYSIDHIASNDVLLNFSLPENLRVEINIYDAAGRYISTPVSGHYSAGVHSVNIKTESNGVYFFNIMTNRFSETGKFLVY